MSISPLAGKRLAANQLVNIQDLIKAYYDNKPDANLAEQKVSFGTSGHRGTSFKSSFNEHHVLAISQAICDYRKQAGITGPLYFGIDTHALSRPAQESAVEVFAANQVEIFLAANDQFTPTPVISHAILTYNDNRTSGLADGVVVTPSHNPPDNGGYKYNPTNGGPADTDVTNWIQQRANELLLNQLRDVKRVSYAAAIKQANVHFHDYLNHYVSDLQNVIDLDLIKQKNIRLGVDPLGGAGLDFWYRIAEVYQLNLQVVNPVIDPQFAFMTADWDGKIRMDPSSSYTMQPLLARRNEFDIACACDADHDRHGIVVPSMGLLTPNSYLAVMVNYLYQNRPEWNAQVAIGKTLVSSGLIDRVAKKLGRPLLEVPVGFKWFAAGLQNGSLGFGGEESAGASFLRRNGKVWSTDKDGIIPCLLAAEIKAKTEMDPGEIYQSLTQKLGKPSEKRVDAPANAAQKKALGQLSPDQIQSTELAGEKIVSILTKAPGNNAAIGGIKVTTENGWFAARPSGTEDIYKIYAESFKGDEHLQALLAEAQVIVDKAIA
jgi:phosphoglucomutase